MDFWNRLIGGSGSVSTLQRRKEHPQPTTPDERLRKFKRIWQQILHTWRNAREKDENSQDVFYDLIKRLTEMLVEEEKRSHRLCMSFVYESQVYIALSKIGQSARLDVVKETMTTFTTLVESEDENFLGTESFAQSLMDFLRKISHRVDPTLQNEFVELLFNISAKIRQTPDILRVWFIPLGSEREFENLAPKMKFAGVTNREDFPLFYLLIHFVYREGRVGDFARTGLLYLIEAATPGSELEKWMMESDLATLMASGVGALYSQLGRKLLVTYSEEEQPTILTLSDYKPAEFVPFEVESSTSPDFQINLETFLSFLTFWQDVLNHCKSTEVKQTLLDHFRVLFLQQLLYPSLIESSDVDGGSAVAVLTYVRVILDTLEHPDIINLILSYLMALPEKTSAPSSGPPSPNVARRRKSLDLLKLMSGKMQETPTLFSLVDLILTSLKSKSQQTVAATLRLVSIILRKHHPYSIDTLVKIHRLEDKGPGRTIGAHNKEMNLFFSMISRIAPEDESGADSYETYLKDNLELLECHPCSAKALADKNPQDGGRDVHPEASDGPREVYMHTIRLDDPLLKSITGMLATFFSNTVEMNLILTAVVVDLATCCYMRPEGWLLFDPATYEYENDEEAELDEEWQELMEDGEIGDDMLEELEKKQMRALKRARKEPGWTKVPPVMEVLQNLTSQIQAYRREIPDLDDKLAERKNAFRLTDHLDEAMYGQAGPAQPPQPSSRAIFDSLRSTISPNSSVRGRDRANSSGYSTPNIVPFGSHVADTSQRKVKPLNPMQFMPPPPEEEGGSVRPGSGSAGGGSGAVTRSETPVEGGGAGGGGGGPTTTTTMPGTPVVEREFSLSHLLTNVLILQEFVMELAALTQVRASLFEDIKFV